MLEKAIRKYHLFQIASFVGLVLSISFLATSFLGIFWGWNVDKYWITFSLTTLILILLGYFTRQFVSPERTQIIRYLDNQYPFLENSSALLFESPKNTFEEWQHEKLLLRLQKEDIWLPTVSFRSRFYSIIILIIIGTALWIQKPTFPYSNPAQSLANQNAVDESELSTIDFPTIKNVEILVRPPAYTKLPAFTKALESMTIPENSSSDFIVTTAGNPEVVTLEMGSASSFKMKASGDTFRLSKTIVSNTIFRFAISGNDSTFFSDYASIIAQADQAPGFVVISPSESRTIIRNSNKAVSFNLEVGDDYGVTNLTLQATLARGSGENVRFREKSLNFDSLRGLGSKKVLANILLDADQLEMKPGDELYFYAEASDNKPEPQTSRSDTYFLFYPDSSQLAKMEISGLAIDLVPEYFRSQRQLIIDTEKLLSEKSSISIKEFGDRS